MGLSDDAPVLLTAGRLVRKKGIEYLIDAVAPLASEWPALRLVVVGDGDLRAELAHRATSHGVASHVHFLGALPQDEVGAWLSAADVVVVPSVKDDAGNVDGLPNVLLEALSSGTPVVTTPVGGIESVAVDGRTARVVAERNSDALVDAVGHLLRQPEVAAALGRAARAEMCRSHGWSTTEELLDNAYTRALASHRA